MKVKHGKSAIWLCLKKVEWITISMESSQRDLFIDIVVDRLTFNHNQITLFPVSPSSSYPKQVLGYLKQGLLSFLCAQEWILQHYWRKMLDE